MFYIAFLLLQLIFSAIVSVYFLKMLHNNKHLQRAIKKQSVSEMKKLLSLEQNHLTMPLSEKTRPASLEDIIGQEQAIKALRVTLCSPNPQHILIYGPPGVGKTAAARVVLEEAKRDIFSPFKPDAKYVEIDATTLRFDERSIADPLMGSVHDPIYQGAGSYGQAGIPQPKAGAITKAHGGVLFIDEIGELHPTQMNKLLKVLEDRRAFFESTYYYEDDTNIPPHIHRIFKAGLPADFRLIGATTRSPQEIPPALRSRCVEIFFNSLNCDEIMRVAQNAARKAELPLQQDALALIGRYASNGREAVNIVQIAGSVAFYDSRIAITRKDVEWVLELMRCSPRQDTKVSGGKQVGRVSGLAVYGHSGGAVMDIEVMAAPSGSGKLTITGIVEQEEITNRAQKIRRTSSARASVENMLTVAKGHLGINTDKYDIHINFPGNTPVDGPSAGIAILCGVYSAVTGKPIDSRIAMTGEISIHGKVNPVGGVSTKIQAAMAAGVRQVIIPKENNQEAFKSLPIEIVPVETIYEVLKTVFREETKQAGLNSSLWRGSREADGMAVAMNNE